MFLFPLTSQKPDRSRAHCPISEIECRRGGLAYPSWLILDEYNQVQVDEACDLVTTPIGAFSPAFVGKIAGVIKGRRRCVDCAASFANSRTDFLGSEMRPTPLPSHYPSRFLDQNMFPNIEAQGDGRLHGATHRVYHAGELDQRPIACALDHASVCARRSSANLDTEQAAD